MTILQELLSGQQSALRLTNASDVEALLQAQPAMEGLLEEAIRRIQQKFGEDTRLELAAVDDERLLLEVVVSLDVDEARARWQELNPSGHKIEAAAQGKLKIALGFASQERPLSPGERRIVESLTPEARAGLGLFKDSAGGRSAVDELINQRREAAARA